MFRKLRIAVLLLILATVALGAWRSGARATEWKHTLHATVYPIAADASRDGSVWWLTTIANARRAPRVVVT